MEDETWVLDRELTQVVFSPTCTLCVHWIGGSGEQWETCAAFPEGIPAEIWSGKNKHLEPVEGDHGIRYERKPVLEVSAEERARRRKELGLDG